MKKPFAIMLLLITMNAAAQTEPFSKRTVISGLNAAWEVVYGPNDSLWITENKAYLVSRISQGGVKTTLLNLSAAKDFTSSGPQPQGGLMGLAIHPNLYSASKAVRDAKPWVYVAYVYHRISSSCPSDGTATACYFNTRIVRYDYTGNTLINPVIILDGMPGSSDHNSGRLVFGPAPESDGVVGHADQYRLYYTIGDMGAGQLTNLTRTNNAQNQDVLEGKVLRLNSEIDGDGGQDNWAPDNNIYYNASAITPRDYVYSMGHRNPQGLSWGVVGGNPILFSTEQSDRADDEINVIQKGGNYGWDKVSGKCDGDVNGFKIGGRNISNEVTNCAGTIQPIFTTFHHNATWPSSYPSNGSGNANWPTAAITSVMFYGNYKIPGWQNSLLLTPLKEDKVYRVKLSADGLTTTGDTISYFRSGGSRIRRIIDDPTGIKFYVARDAGTIVEYTYTGTVTTLPIKLISFRGALHNNASLLQWEIAGDASAQQFEVQRSIDGTNYSSIGVVNASGSAASESYNFLDNAAANQPASLLYYRLKMVEKDQQFTFSNVITISLVPMGGRIVITPNPLSTEAKVTITASLEGKAEWKMMDNAGRIMLRGTENLRIGNNQLLIGTSNLAAGIYYFKLEGSNISQQVKFQKL